MSVGERTSVAVRGTEGDWIPIDEVWAGVSIKFLHHEPESGLLVALFKFAPGTQLPRHEHPSDGHGFIIEGEYIQGSESYGALTYVLAPAGMPHGDDAKAGSDGYLALGLYPHGSGIFERFLPSSSTNA